ncbi:MAG: pullulanase-type alpha-1,6-glucosidase [Chloroflexi bacterium]|nr:MAG: pullulanase-type alpha-1,6-glucosidase [Chloroflexota bacterium]
MDKQDVRVENGRFQSTDQRAHWLTADTIAWPLEHEDGNLYLLHVGGENGTTFPLSFVGYGLPKGLAVKFPHLSETAVFKLDAPNLDDMRAALKESLAISAKNSSRQTVRVTGLQIPGVLDDVYAYEGPLGISWEDGCPTLRVWAPTAQNVRLHLFDTADCVGKSVFAMQLDADNGVWSICGEPAWRGSYFLYEVQVFVPSTGRVETNLVTDPYSISLSMNSARSQIVDLNDGVLMPDGWLDVPKPALDAPVDIVIYELHVRDFSVNDALVPAEVRGTFKAFTLLDTNGMKHLAALADAGLTHLHLLPTFDIASIDEDKSKWNGRLFEELAAFAPDSDQQQARVNQQGAADPFNWGYDPWHFNVPEGGYSTNPNGTTRIVEYREMVQSLNQLGLRVVMDVVFNHTNASGQNGRSVLDRIVPGYYHRLEADGRVASSTCCDNTATEHKMMRKLMIDSVVMWATAYKIDGFRFDLMGHHMKADMLAVRAALDGLTIKSDGIDGKCICLYGEGWDFGEVADNARGVNATQTNMAGTGIGTYNDRLRDAVRGGSYDSGRTEQGFVNGLYTFPNAFEQGSKKEQLAKLLALKDQIRVGLAGNLKRVQFVNAHGELTTGEQVAYNNTFTGYSDDPQENIVYASKHDNETLFDIIQYKAPVETETAVRAQMQQLCNAIVMFSQGIPFFQAGDDMLRSKSMDRNSYHSGDWFNRLDFSYQSNNWGVGLPPKPDNGAQWGVIRPLLANKAMRPSPQDIEQTVQHFQELLNIRRSSQLFRLRTAAYVKERLKFHNTGPKQVPGLIVLSISDQVGEELDPDYKGIVVLFNASPNTQSFVIDEMVGLPFMLHPLQLQSRSEFGYDAARGEFVVPGWKTAVFVLPRNQPEEKKGCRSQLLHPWRRLFA